MPAGFWSMAFGQVSWTGVLNCSCVNTNFQLPTAELAKENQPFFFFCVTSA